MSDAIKHECGVALIRLRKPLDYYKEKYGTPLYGLNKLYLLMEKQHNRGQDGAGVGVVKLGLSSRAHFMNRQRSNSPQAISEIFQQIGSKISELKKLNPELFDNTEWLKKNAQFVGEIMMGHLRYGTHGKNELDSCHPFIINDQSALRSLQMCGNFNLTNIEELGSFNEELSDRPDTAIVLERMSAHLDSEIERVHDSLKNLDISRTELNQKIGEEVNFHNILKNATAEFDGGYNMVGMSGTGVAFVLRDARGIRPSYYFANDELVVAASERTALQTAFHIPLSEIKELTPGCALIIDQRGNYGEFECQPKKEKTSCSFERIYFSRGSDVDIYNERKMLGNYLTEQVVNEINHDFKNTVFSFIPNTAEVAFYGLIKGGEDVLNEWKMKAIREPKAVESDERVQEILRRR
ncbi:MAG TPA: amidophosphoribosyltransferase, partial [Bacteroidetes bacterium]|nr:amidophosphoribosyltransferase [Bacteroidota bacterium]